MLSSVSLIFRERLVHVVFCCLQIFLIICVRTLQVKQLDCLIRHHNHYEVPVDAVHIDQDIELIQGSESSFGPTVIVSYCFGIISSSFSTFDEKPTHGEGQVCVHFRLACVLS